MTARFLEKWNALTAWVGDNAVDLLIAAGMAAAVVILLLLVRGVARRMLTGTTAKGWRNVAERVAARTRLFFIVMAAAKIVADQLDLPERIEDAINFLFVVAVAFQVAIWIRAFIIGAIEARVGAGAEYGTLGTAVGLIRVLVSIAVFAVATIVILDNVGVNVTGLVAGLGIGGIAIGLAAQGIFSDLFAALAIIFDRPFRRGDNINVGGGPGGQVGTVENIGLKSTRIRALDGELVAYGNAELLKVPIHNMALLERRRVVMRFGVTYETAPDLLEAIPREVQQIIEAHGSAAFDRSQLMGFGDSSLDYETVYIIEGAEYALFAQTRHEIMLAVIRRFAELGVAFAYPTQTSYMAAPDGTLVMPWPPNLANSDGDAPD